MADTHTHSKRSNSTHIYSQDKRCSKNSTYETRRRKEAKGRTYVEEHESVIKLKIKPETNRENGKVTIKSLVNKYRGDASSTKQTKIKVKITPRSEKPKVTLIDLQREDVTHQTFIYQEHVEGLKKELLICEENIRKDLVEKMLAFCPQ